MPPRDAKRWKAHLIDWQEYQSFELLPEEEPRTNMICLTPQEVMLLQAALTPLRWSTRWTNLDQGADINAIISELENKLICSDGCCDQVLWCVLNDQRIMDAIAGQLGDRDNWDDPGGDGLPGVASSEDCAWAAASEAVKYWFETARQAVDAMETAANAAEAMNDWLALPGSPAGVVLSGLLDVFNSASFAAVATFKLGLVPNMETKVACKLFCLIVENDFKFNDQVYDAMIGWLSLAGPGGGFTPEQSVTAPFLATTTRWLAGRRSTYQRYAAFLDECNNNWQVLCDPCQDCDWPITIDFDQVDCYLLSSLYNTPQVIDDSGEFYAQSNGAYSSSRTVVDITATVLADQDEDVSQVEYDWYVKIGSKTGGAVFRKVQLFDQNDDLIATIQQTTAPGTLEVWNTETINISTVPGVRKVTIQVSRADDFGVNVANQSFVRLDSISIS